jgi:hypothetical protein
LPRFVATLGNESQRAATPTGLWRFPVEEFVSLTIYYRLAENVITPLGLLPFVTRFPG